MAHESKLMRARENAKNLRAEVRELQGEVSELEEPNPTTLRQFVAIPIINVSAFTGSFTFVKLQKMGWMPKRVPVDGIAGGAVQLITAFFHGPFVSVIRDGAHGVTAGAAGRVGAQAAMETIETKSGPAWVKPQKPVK